MLGTYSLGIFKADVDGREVYLLDTPGFDVSSFSLPVELAGKIIIPGLQKVS
jgi:hypothetical protein